MVVEPFGYIVADLRRRKYGPHRLAINDLPPDDGVDVAQLSQISRERFERRFGPSRDIGINYAHRQVIDAWRDRRVVSRFILEDGSDEYGDFRYILIWAGEGVDDYVEYSIEG